MLKFVIVCAFIAGASAGYASSQYAGAGTSSGLYNQVHSTYADKYPYTNTGLNGGFTSNYAGPNGVGVATGTGAFTPGFTPGFAPYQAVPFYPNVFDFNSFYQGLQANFANLYQQQLAHQNAIFNSIRQQAAYAGAGNAAGGGFTATGPNYAGASASYGPGGFHQTAHIYPENPSNPNIDTRFGGSEQSGGPGFVGVSSFSSSSNINGQTHREAATSVNDNGKVTSYHVRS